MLSMIPAYNKKLYVFYRL